jgi:prephenate dehydratase
MAKKIAIQGFEGSFHQEAAWHYYGRDVEVVPCATFRETVKLATDRKVTDGGLMAIENSLAGSILPNYTLLQKSNLRVTGEIYLQIRQQLLALPGVKLEDIREVHSHPMAILQCTAVLEQYGWKLVETEDTALSAKHIRQHKPKHIAAIASKIAAEMFGLQILLPNIHTLKNNYTRFLVLQKDDKKVSIEGADKASLYFQTNHMRGSLARVLTKIAENEINLSKLQSFPIPGSNWKYFFHVDMEFDTIDKFHKVLAEIGPITEALKVYGIYKKGKTF